MVTSPVSRGEADTNMACSSSSFMERVQGLSGKPLCLPKPSLTTGALRVIWQVTLSSESQNQRILKWIPSLDYEDLARNHFKDRLKFTAQDNELLLQPALSKDSGTYSVEVTDDSGNIYKNEVVVTVLDPVGDPYMWVLFKDRNTTSCQLVLNCSVEADNVIVSWYRDDVKLSESSGSSAQVVQSVLANSSHVYSCNVSANLSWAHRSFSLTPGCAVSVDASESQRSLSLWLVYPGVLLSIVLLSTITLIFLWRKRGRTGQTDVCNQESVEQSLPVPQDPCLVQSNYAQVGHSSHEESSTVYSVVHSRGRKQKQNQNQSQNQCSVSTPPESESTTLYSMVQLSQSPREKTPNTSMGCTIYHEIGEVQPGAQNPARLSRKELQNFKVYC